MRRWTRAVQDTWCGFCSEVIAVGDPMLVKRVAGVTQEYRRCLTCAGEPVDEEQLEAEDVRAEATLSQNPAAPPPRTWGSVVDLVRDYKRAQGRDEE